MKGLLSSLKARIPNIKHSRRNIKLTSANVRSGRCQELITLWQPFTRSTCEYNWGEITLLCPVFLMHMQPHTLAHVTGSEFWKVGIIRIHLVSTASPTEYNPHVFCSEHNTSVCGESLGTVWAKMRYIFTTENREAEIGSVADSMPEADIYCKTLWFL